MEVVISRPKLNQNITFILIGIIGILLGIIFGRTTSTTTAPVVNQTPADDGKLAKEYKEKNLVKVIKDNAKSLQVCYFAFLDKKPSVTEGVMDILIKVEEDGKISSARITKDEFIDKDFESCLISKFNNFYLAPPPLGINRYMSHVLAFKSEATALKEEKEWQENNKPPMMLPVGPASKKP